MATQRLTHPRKVSPPFGRTIRNGLAELGDLGRYSVEAVRHSPGSLTYFAETVRQIGILISGSTLFLMLLTFGIGAECSLWYNSWARTLGASDFTGYVNVPCGIQLAWPYLFANAFAAKIGSGFVAEIGAMSISDEIDALEVSGIDSMRYVIGTRLMAVLIFVPVAYYMALLAGLVGGLLSSVYQLHELTAAWYFHGYWTSQTITDNLQSLIQAMAECYGVALICLYYGYRARGGPVGVGNAVARAMVVNIFYLAFMASICMTAFYGQGAHITFGG